MAPIKIKVDQSILDEPPSLCRIPHGKKRDMTFLLDDEKLKASDETCDYNASSSKNSSSSRYYCLGTLDTTKASEDGYQILTLRPVKKVYDTWETSVRGYEQQLTGPTDYRTQYKAMIEDFATAKKQKVVRSREMNRLVGDDSKARVTEGDEAKPPSAVEIATNEWRKAFLPPWNEKCPEPSNVYDFQTFTGPSLWNRITQMANNGFDTEGCPPSIETLFEGRLNEERVPTQLQLTCGVLCAFLSNLYIRLNFKRRIPAVDNKPTFFGQPTAVAERFLTKFTTMLGNNRVMAKANKDSCLVHILLLYLVASHKRAKVESLRDLTTDLMIDGVQASQLLRQAGCKTVRKANTYSAAIQTPLQFPKISRGGRKPT